ncbi:MAG: tetratricopeptide repeat protein, partial [Myxococcota bacterium]
GEPVVEEHAISTTSDEPPGDATSAATEGEHTESLLDYTASVDEPVAPEAGSLATEAEPETNDTVVPTSEPEAQPNDTWVPTSELEARTSDTFVPTSEPEAQESEDAGSEDAEKPASIAEADDAERSNAVVLSSADVADTVIEPAPPAEDSTLSDGNPPPTPSETDKAGNTHISSHHGRRVRPTSSISLAPQGAMVSDASQENSSAASSTETVASAGISPSGRGRYSVAEDDASTLPAAASTRGALRRSRPYTGADHEDDDDDVTQFLRPRIWLFTRAQAAALVAATVTAGAASAWWSRGDAETPPAPAADVVNVEDPRDNASPGAVANEIPVEDAGAEPGPAASADSADDDPREVAKPSPPPQEAVTATVDTLPRPTEARVEPTRAGAMPSPPPSQERAILKTEPQVPPSRPSTAPEGKGAPRASRPQVKPPSPASAATRPPANNDDKGSAKATDGRQERYREMLTLAEGHSRAGRWRDAVTSFKLAIEQDPNSAVAHYGLGNAYFELDSVQNALRHLERSRALQDNTPDVHLLLGAVYQTAGRLKDARRAYEKYLQLAPKGKFVRDVNAILETLEE